MTYGNIYVTIVKALLEELRLEPPCADEDISAKWRFGPGPLLLRLLRRKTQLGLRLGGR